MIARESPPLLRNATKATMMESSALVPAAQYVRMSTEDQQYSIANQESVIADYARKRGFEVISTYSDPGKSGISIRSRKGLRQLLSDVIGGKARFRSILVYDVSRWGRFQDIDESAHYEFLCRSARITVHYCAEQFVNDGSVASSIMKTIKRTMAAEYSRELGVKVLAGQQRIALLGFRAVGMAAFGLRRMMVSPDGRRKLVLQDRSREIGWLLFLRQCHRHLPALVCTVDPSHSKLLDFYVLPPFKGSAKQKIVRGDIPWVRSGKRLEKIEDLCSVANEIATNSNTRRPCVAVGDVLFREDTWTFSIGPRGISLGPVTAALFRVLLMNANCIVSNQQLMRAIPEEIDASDLSKRIYILRDKLGAENAWRIHTVRGVGYMYVTPEQSFGESQSNKGDRFSILPCNQLALPPEDRCCHGVNGTDSARLRSLDRRNRRGCS